MITVVNLEDNGEMHPDVDLTAKMKTFSLCEEDGPFVYVLRGLYW